MTDSPLARVVAGGGLTSEGTMGLLNQTFLVPIVRDGDKSPHNESTWLELRAKMVAAFGGFTAFQSLANGFWTDPVKGSVGDKSMVCMVAIPGDGQSVAKFLEIMSWIKVAFDQQTIFSFSSVCELL